MLSTWQSVRLNANAICTHLLWWQFVCIIIEVDLNVARSGDGIASNRSGKCENRENASALSMMRKSGHRVFRLQCKSVRTHIGLKDASWINRANVHVDLIIVI